MDEVPEIVLSIARASQDLDQATIDKAMECFTNAAVECDTGTGEVIMGYADGGGTQRMAQVTRMEAILPSPIRRSEPWCSATPSGRRTRRSRSATSTTWWSIGSHVHNRVSRLGRGAR